MVSKSLILKPHILEVTNDYGKLVYNMHVHYTTNSFKLIKQPAVMQDIVITGI